MEATSNNVNPNAIQYAGFWIRVCAAIIDTILYIPFYYTFVKLFPSPQFLGDGIFMVFALFTYTWWFASKWQGTPGMRVMKFHVCDVNGKRISYLRSFIWGITGTFGWLIMGAGLFYLMQKYDIEAINHYMYSPEVKENGFDPAMLEQLLGTSIQDYLFYAAIAVGLFFLTSFIWSLSIGLSKQKAGFHNVICRTRFVKGLPDMPPAA
jgi:uncharacterized RDD family membrane protein YckC